MLRSGILRAGAMTAILLLMFAWAVGGMAASTDAVWPAADGADIRADGRLEVDASNISLGHVMVRAAEPSKRALKIRVAFGKTQLTYDLNNQGEYEAFPLQLGSGKYEISLYENVKGSKFSAEGKVKLDAKLVDENAAYTVPNQYVNYELFTSAVQKSDELCKGAGPEECYRIITDFISSEFAYDFVRAKTISSGALPDIDYCYENRMGICQDLSAVMCCMLRVQHVPCKLVIGYADKYYHAWTSSVLDGKDLFFDPTAAIGALKAKKYKIERMY